MSKEYQLIKQYYGDQTTKRSGVRLIAHIDEGLELLEMVNGSDKAKKAYCLHPLVQQDKELSENHQLLSDVDPEIVLLALEYRNIANQYLSDRKIGTVDDIKLSPLQDVNDMLKADKIQNYKDFVLHHYGKHERSDILNKYFHNWFDRLQMTRREVSQYIRRLSDEEEQSALLDKLHIGFTGTHRGMTAQQVTAVRKLLSDEQDVILHHGDCIGADASADGIIKQIGAATIIHPPEKTDKCAFCPGALIVMDPKDYLERDHDIVDDSVYLIATPESVAEVIRSGTWATIRYGRKQGKRVVLVYPDGTIRDELRHGLTREELGGDLEATV